MEVGPFADVIFTGLARAYSGENRVDRYVVVDFDVATVYKGPPASRIQVQAVGGRGPSGGLGPGCEYGFQLGQQYTVFAKDHDSDGVPNTNGLGGLGCSRSNSSLETTRTWPVSKPTRWTVRGPAGSPRVSVMDPPPG